MVRCYGRRRLQTWLLENWAEFENGLRSLDLDELERIHGVDRQLVKAAALEYANAAGARNVTVQGPMEGAGSRAELDEFIAATPRNIP